MKNSSRGNESGGPSYSLVARDWTSRPVMSPVSRSAAKNAVVPIATPATATNNANATPKRVLITGRRTPLRPRLPPFGCASEVRAWAHSIRRRLRGQHGQMFGGIRILPEEAGTFRRHAAS